MHAKQYELILIILAVPKLKIKGSELSCALLAIRSTQLLGGQLGVLF